MKKKKLLYNGLATLEKGHLLTAMYFAFYGLRNRPGHRGKVAGQITGWETCRESVANLVRNSLADGPYNIKGIAMNATKILVMLRNRKEKPEEAEKRAGKIIKRGVRILNIFEKEMGWRYTVPFRVPVEECPGTFLCHKRAKGVDSIPSSSIHLSLVA